MPAVAIIARRPFLSSTSWRRARACTVQDNTSSENCKHCPEQSSAHYRLQTVRTRQTRTRAFQDWCCATREQNRGPRKLIAVCGCAVCSCCSLVRDSWRPAPDPDRYGNSIHAFQGTRNRVGLTPWPPWSGGRAWQDCEHREGRLECKGSTLTLGSLAQLRGSKPKSPGWRSPPWSIWTMATNPKSSKKPIHTSSCCIAPCLTAASWSAVILESPA